MVEKYAYTPSFLLDHKSRSKDTTSQIERLTLSILCSRLLKFVTLNNTLPVYGKTFLSIFTLLSISCHFLEDSLQCSRIFNQQNGYFVN